MRPRLGVRAVAAGICFGLVLFSAVAAANSVPDSRAGLTTTATSAESLKPSACSAITLSAIVKGSGTFSGGLAAELIVGSSGADTISGSDGDDCILGGGGDDTFAGGAGNDVCIGGPGTDENGVIVLFVRTDQCETFIQ